MECKITVTTECGAKCKTCPSWKEPKKVMSYPAFAIIWDKLIKSKQIHKIILNSTGDMSTLSDVNKYYDLIDNTKTDKFIVLQTNAQKLDRIPNVNHLVISFNGVTKEQYEFTTGLNWDRVIANIKSQYPRLKQISCVEMHVLVWDGNKIDQEKLKYFADLWDGFPGKIRFSEKVENQFGFVQIDEKLDREPCDYLQKLIIYADGSAINCAHDFSGKTAYCNLLVDSIDTALFHPKKLAILYNHSWGKFEGLCKNCNYNVPVGDRVKYLERVK